MADRRSSYHSIEDDESEASSLLLKDKPPPGSVEDTGFYSRRIQPCLVELLGTTLFVFIGTLTAQNQLLLTNAVGHGLTIATLILAFGKISGGHFNPAVTLGAWIAGGIDFMLLLGYWLVQLSGGILGAAITRGCLSYQKQVDWLPPNNNTVYEQIGGGALTLQPGATVAAGILVEFMLTLVLVMVVLMTAVDSRTQTPTAGLAIGFAVAVDINAGGGITQAAMNPARALGPAIVVSDLRPDVWTNHYIYWVGPLLGACAAGMLYRLFYSAQDRRILFKKRQ